MHGGLFSVRREGFAIDPKKLAVRIAAVAKARKAKKVIILDVRTISSLCDYFVIASGTSLRQVGAITQAIEEDLSKEKVRSRTKILPDDESGWLALDYTSVVAHIFYKPLREFYALERLWQDAKKVRLPANPAA